MDIPGEELLVQRFLNPTPLNRRFLELVAAELAESVQP
jgi:hypothetical protein